MKKISKQQGIGDALQIYKTCVKGYPSKSKRDELAAYEDKVDFSSIEYNKYMPNEFEKIAPPSITASETEVMKSVYEYRFVHKRCGGFYDKILANANNICPFCGEGRPMNLDHFLPKVEYPFLVVTPENLVPSCRDCNMDKNDMKPTCNEEVPLHPYYDDISLIWLETKIDYSHKDILIFDFYNSLNIVTEPMLFKRIDVHMKIHGLKASFESHAISEINSKKRNHLRFIKNTGDSLRTELQGERDSYKADLQEFMSSASELSRSPCNSEAEDINSWRSALYRELLRNIDKYTDWLQRLSCNT